MILDKNTMVADGLAFDGTPTVIDLGAVRPGPGNPIKMFVSSTAAMAGATGVAVTDGSTVAAADALLTHVATLDGGALVEFELPSDVARYVKVALTGTVTAGAWSCGVILPGAQTNA